MAAGLSSSDIGGSLGVDDIGDGHITGRLEPLLLRFVRDGGQDWLKVGPTDAKPPGFYSFDDVQIALGWKTVSQVLDMRDVEPLGDVLNLVASRWPEIIRMLSGGSSRVGWKRVEKAAAARGEGFAARLR
jgi:hypothetical protein